MQKIVSSLLFLLCLTMAACTASQQSRGVSYVQSQAQNMQSFQGFEEEHIQTSTFTLYALVHKASHEADTVHVYIEGDGLAWVSRYKVSQNPTPTEDTTLNLAAHDPSITQGTASVAYLARPCQYVQGTAAKLCQPKYWTTARFAPEVITALSEAIDTIKAQVHAKYVVLVGYSGGGPSAALVAAQRQDVIFLGSVAGNLDVHGWTQWHKVSPLKDSLSPMQELDNLRSIPQRHMSSYDDAIVPPSIGQNYCKALYKPEYCEHIYDMEHSDPWHKVWNYSYK